VKLLPQFFADRASGSFDQELEGQIRGLPILVEKDTALKPGDNCHH
jgi:hypothetical protein